MADLTSSPAPLSWFTKSTFRYTPLVAEIMVLAVVLRLLGLVQPFLFQTLIDRVLPFQREATLVMIVAVLTLSTLFSASLSALSSYLGNHMANRLTAELAARIFHHVLHLPLRYLQRWQVGETLTRIGEIDRVRTFLTGTVSGIALDALFATIYIIALLSISPLLTGIVLIILPLQVVTFAVIGPFLRRRMQTSFLARSHHQSRIVEAFGNVITVKALACEGAQIDRLQETLGKTLFTGFRVTKLNILNGFFGDILGSAPTILIMLVGSQLIFQNHITLGELIAFYLLTGKVSGPIMSLSSVWEQWQGLRIARLRLGDLLNTAAEDETPKPALQVSEHMQLSLQGVSFAYVPDQPVIQDMTLSIGPDRPTVIIGDSGSGKSTLGKLLSGLYNPSTGKIDANGQNLAECDPGSVRRALAYLPQEPILFSGSILDNMLLANPAATEDDINRVLAGTASDRFMRQLPLGIHSDVGERGGNLSGGQRQRIAIARSLLTNPRALILDEPTSALDAHSAGIVVETLKRLAQGVTLIVITHNPGLLGEDVNVIDLNRRPAA
jgi:ATP-binding cassette, subfamily B, bacterial HlyB/CyaB